MDSKMAYQLRLVIVKTSVNGNEEVISASAVGPPLESLEEISAALKQLLAVIEEARK